MKKVCFINQGENIEKISYRLDLKINKNQVKEGFVFENQKYITLEDGNDDIIIVKNYNPLYIKKINKNTDVLDVYATCYDIEGGDIDNCDYIVLHNVVGVKYYVKPLEKIEDIALKFSVSKEYIMDTNNLKTDKLFVGQRLLI